MTSNQYFKCRITFVFVVLFALGTQLTNAQINYEYSNNKNFALGSYGRVGVDWSFENGESIGRRLNLNNMGSIGGRLEEQDYVELVPNFMFRPKAGDSTEIHVQVRLSIYSRSLTYIGNTSTSGTGGLTFQLPELYAEARNIRGKDLNIWIGSRVYRGPDVHIADHFYYNDHSGQGVGVEYKKSRLAAIFVSSVDTTSTLPPYFYLNIETGTPSAALRQRTVLVGEHDFKVNENSTISALAELHYIGDGNNGNETTENEDIEDAVNFPSDRGFVIGGRYHNEFSRMKAGSFNDFTLRYGTGIANGGDGGMSKTWLTYGAPNESLTFKGAYSLALVNHTVLNVSDNYAFNGYVILTHSKGGADSNGLAPTYFGKEVYNRKTDFTIGSRNEFFISDYFHLLAELHYSQRKDGENPTASMTKLSVSPVLVPTGKRNIWARPHLRFVASVARYNDYAMESLYSPYLQFVGEKRWGYYLGFKAEWWIWK
ncbi:maltoporin [Formosa agariphila KMM 3901]|uniref:Maltoporin n=1 Tax=Formosa agariphila (strain DSM 15362 / KCTC 12365 / LMG 23005 / KMM 3901 / M-2Alg 35-1) TaxID=1347342 RepID=T2KKZ9_FORAG|nr:carbohydrate porin [Formosa agariphila]CDF79118.1 maltoporin [Formosa agariphila KMM 3901]